MDVSINRPDKQMSLSIRPYSLSIGISSSLSVAIVQSTHVIVDGYGDLEPTTNTCVAGWMRAVRYLEIGNYFLDFVIKAPPHDAVKDVAAHIDAIIIVDQIDADVDSVGEWRGIRHGGFLQGFLLAQLI